MRFAMLRNHPDGAAVAKALANSGRHQVVPSSTDIEEILADPAVDAVIVAGEPGERLDQLRRVLQSERPAFCVHPVDAKADGAYEIDMLQGDVHQIVMPLLPLAVNRGVTEFAQKVQSAGQPRLIELEYRSAGELLFDREAGPHFPGWELLRALGGAVAEVQAFAPEETVRRGEPVTLQGRFESGALFRAAYLPGQPATRISLRAVMPDGEIDSGPIEISERDWAELVNRFDSAIAHLKVSPRAAPGAGLGALTQTRSFAAGPTWLDEIRAAELDDAGRRSIERRRAVTLEYQTVTEDVGFKGTMTLVGCGLLWAIPVLLLASVWLPQVGWLIVPVLFGFLLLQLLRWLVPMPAGQGEHSALSDESRP
jgi:predicted dehydrogenase